MWANLVSKGLALAYTPPPPPPPESIDPITGFIPGFVCGSRLLAQWVLQGGRPYKGLSSCAESGVLASPKKRVRRS